ncbi:MAG: oligosaccharide flippase family protein, partial [Ignavibacteria bacterium]
MSLTDKVIKNTFYHFLSQFLGFLSPLILIPIIISKIGPVDFGIYVIVLGFIGSFGLLDMSLSSSFIRFISEHYNLGERESLAQVINTGFLFYFFYSVIVALLAYFFGNNIISLINIPPEKVQLAFTSFYIALIIFSLTNSFSIFNSIIISLQKIYLGAIASSIITSLYLTAVLLLMFLGFGLISLLLASLTSTIVSIIVTLFIVKRILPEIQISPKSFSKDRFKEMFKFGIQMQISRLATFTSEKYDEFLLGVFSILNNVTFFNLGNKVASYGKLIPAQLIIQIAPVAAELKAKEETEKLKQLFIDSTKYLNTAAIPIFIYLFTFADILIFAWIGNGYELSAQILRILVVGFLINFMLSVPGNSIIPNTGKPKYQMIEGLIYLSINVILSYILIKNYNVIGAAIGSTISTLIASLYILRTSNDLFKTKAFQILRQTILH